MTNNSKTHFPFMPPVKARVIILLLTALSCILPSASSANPDVYDALPGDTRILQYNLADFDGDAREELAVLYTTSDETRLTLFRGDSGRWSRWWDDNGGITHQDGSAPRSMEIRDTNGDGRAEMLAYYLTEKNTVMAIRILTLDDRDPSNPVFNVILEDKVSPPGYPLVGMEAQAFSVTFFKMATSESNGYRRVYCWNKKRFEKCVEVEWEKP